MSKDVREPEKTEEDHIASIKKELMPTSLAGKSYTKKDSANTWIVIHNTGGFNTAKQTADYFAGGAFNGTKNVYTCTHYCVDDKEIYQLLENTWQGVHAGKAKAGMYGADRGCGNSNSIGIEVCDGEKCDKNKAVEICIELTRYLCKELNISVDNVVRHYDVSGKDCPSWIMKNNKWDYIKEQIKLRNDQQLPISFDTSTIQTVTGSSNSSSGSSTLPNFDNREDWTNLKEIKGIILNYLPPYHSTSIKNKEDHFLKYEYDREYHYICDSSQFIAEKDKSLIAFSMQDNNRHTYIERALYANQAPKYTLSVGIFTSSALEDYTVTEKLLIDNIAKLLYENNLTPNDLWREFDLNRAPSPLIYLDRAQWKKFLKEIDTQYTWRVANFGEIEQVTPVPDGVDLSLNINQNAITNRRCGLRETASYTSNFKILKKGTKVTITSYQSGFYKVQLQDDVTKEGYIAWDSLTIGEEGISLYTDDNGIPQPEITPTMTHEEYLKYIAYADPKLIDEYVQLHEPYDKGLDEIINATVSNDDRLNILTKIQETENENTIHYNVVEATPGGSDHCVKASEELNSLYKPDNLKVDPIYPDLIIPPNYSSSDFNKNDDNRIPLTALDELGIADEEAFTKQFAFNYDLLDELNKKSKGSPVNYADPYPYDDKVIELEKHHPKVKIDEIESRLYSCNHPGCPIAQPMAKNFAMIMDAMLAQSKKIEQRLVRAENTLAVVLRNQGRMASRVNINCVYYGGQDVFGKYKNIRCLKDDRINDGCSVTMDQCLACTRYEPIIGQIYEILDETGINGSAILDDMQMSYMDLDEYKNLNKVENRSTKYKYADVSKIPNETPKSLIDEWKERDKNKYIESLKSTITDAAELEKKISAINEDDYMFIMDWEEKHLESQEPDVKPYPNEGIKAKYKVKIGDPGDNDIDLNNNISSSDELEDDVKFDVENYNKIMSGEWVDTREEADTIELNKYSSENYYFEDFNKDTSGGGNGSVPGASWGAEARKKILEMADKIVADCANGEAWYECNPPRTTNYDKPVKRDTSGKKNQTIYDCSSFVSCCYRHAALTSVVDKLNYDQYKATKDGGGLLWKADEDGLAKLSPGDLIWKAKHTVSDPNDITGSSHIMIYYGDGKIAHAANPTKGIVIQDMKGYVNSTEFVCGRPKDLIDADAAAATGVGGGQEYNDTVTAKDGSTLNCVWKFNKAVITAYDDLGDFSASTETGIYATIANRSTKKYCAAHNMPYGTKIYIPDYDGVMGENNKGIFTVVDSGGPYYDFDLYVPDCRAVGKSNKDVYVLEWGSYKTKPISFTYWMDKYTDKQWNTYLSGWHTYKSMNGVTIDFHKFLDADKTVKSHPRYNT